MHSLPLFGSESSPVAPPTCCRAPLLVQHPCCLLSGATTRSTTRPPPLELDCLLVAIIAYLQAPPLIPCPYRVVKRCRRFFRARGPAGHHRALSSPTARSRATSRARLLAGCPHHVFHAPAASFSAQEPAVTPVVSIIERRRRLSAPTATSGSRARLLAGHHCHLLSSPTARSTPPPPFFESDRSFHALTRSTTLLCAVEHRRFFRA